jgi:hypothetical protein
MCLARIFAPLQSGMTDPEVVRCPDGHFRRVIYSLGPYIADYPEQVWFASELIDFLDVRQSQTTLMVILRRHVVEDTREQTSLSNASTPVLSGRNMGSGVILL